MFCGERCPEKFRKFHRKTPVLESHFKKAAGLNPATLLKRDSNAGLLLWNLWNFKERLFWKISVNDYFYHKIFEPLQIGVKILKTRSSHQKCSIKEAILKNFAIFTGKRPCWSLFLTKLQTCYFMKRRLHHRYFPMDIAKFLRTPILKNIWERLLL